MMIPRYNTITTRLNRFYVCVKFMFFDYLSEKGRIFSLLQHHVDSTITLCKYLSNKINYIFRLVRNVTLRKVSTLF